MVTASRLMDHIFIELIHFRTFVLSKYFYTLTTTLLHHYILLTISTPPSGITSSSSEYVYIICMHHGFYSISWKIPIFVSLAL